MATVTVISPVTGKPVEHKRVAAYCRVSSNSADQENSYQAQTFYNIYSFKENIDSALNEALSLEALNGLSDYTSAAGDGWVHTRPCRTK